MIKQLIGKCPDCGTELEEGAISCPECGCPVVMTSTNGVNGTHSNRKTMRRIVAVVMCLVACFCIYKCFCMINDSNYKFYKEHYSECMQGYAENTATAASYSYGFFKSSYQDIANRYQDMANDDMKEIWKYRIAAIAFGASGVLLFIMAAFVQRHRRK